MTTTFTASAFSLALAGLALSGLALAAPAHAETLEIRDFVGRVEVRTGNYDRIEARVTGGESLGEEIGDARIDRQGGDVVIDGGNERRWGWVDCRGSGANLQVRINGRGDRSLFGGFRDRGEFVPVADLPLIEVTAPDDVELQIENVMLMGEIGDVGGGRVANGFCADLRIGDVSGDFDASHGGSGRMTIGEVGGDLDARLAGSGEMIVGDVRGHLGARVEGSGEMAASRAGRGVDIHVLGSGSTDIETVSGDIGISIAGSGDVMLAGGSAGAMDISIMGSGDVSFGGTAERLDVSVAGSGDVDVANAGDSDVRIAGSGDVRVAGRRID